MKELREYLDISAAEFARMIGCSNAHISMIEHEKSNIMPEFIDKICTNLNVDKNYFIENMKVEDAAVCGSKDERKQQICERIRNTRLERGIGSRELDRLAGFANGMSSHIERGKYSLSEKNAEKIGIALGVSKEWLLTGDESKKEYPVNSRMIEWLWAHSKIRKMLWEKLSDEINDELWHK